MGCGDTGRTFTMVDHRDDEGLSQGIHWGKHETYLGGKIVRTRTSSLMIQLLSEYLLMAVPNGGRNNKHKNENIKPHRFLSHREQIVLGLLGLGQLTTPFHC